jgi:periplasmic protein TonB
MSNLGNLSECMVDNDPEVRARARRLRQKALAVSLCIEALCLGAMLVWPLITPGVLPSRYIVTPLPPYSGGGNAPHSTPSHHLPRPHDVPPQTHLMIFRPPTQSTHWQRPSADDAPAVDGPIADGPGQGNGPGDATSFIGIGNPNGLRLEPPRSPDPVRPVRQKMSAGVMESALIHRVEPVYPRIAISMRLSGTVQLRAIIATDGSVQNLEILSGSPILARAAEDAVRQWRYRPTLLSGVPVEVETYITVNFVLGEQ